MLLAVSQGFQSVLGSAKFYLLQRYYIRTIQITLALSCLLVAVIATILTYKRPTFAAIAIAGFIGAGVVIFMYRHMELATWALVIISTIMNFGIGTGTGTPITLTLALLLLLTGLWLVRILFDERSFQSIRPAAVNLPALVFGVAVGISLFWGVFYAEPHVTYMVIDRSMPRYMTALVLIISPIAALIFANHIRSLFSMKALVWYYILFGGVTMIFQIFMSDFIPRPMWNTGGQLPVWASAFALGQVFFNKNLSNQVRAACLIVVAGWLYVQMGLGIDWLSGWLPLCFALGILCVLYSRVLVAMLCILVLIFILVNIDEVYEMIEEERNISGDTRVEAWDRTMSIVDRHLLFGTGPTGYFFYLTIEIGGFFQLSHNNYVDIIAQTGLFGFSVFMWFWLAVGWIYWKLYQIVPPGGFEQALAFSLIACYFVTLLCMMLGDWVTPFTYTQTLSGISYTIWHWLLAGLGISLYYYVKEQPPQNSIQQTQAA